VAAQLAASQEELGSMQLEYWSVLSPVTPICGKLDFSLGNQVQFNSEISHLQIKVNPWNCVKMVQHGKENQKSALFHFRPKVDTEQHNTFATNCWIYEEEVTS
jgi:hypothetical protein